MSRENLRRPIAGILAILGWFAIVTQFFLIQQNSDRSFLETTINFFSFFTILTNLIVAICATTLLLGIKNGTTTARSITAIAVYITIVGLVYNLVLRSMWDPKGLQKLTDELLHSAIPIVFVVYWLLFAARDLAWKNAVQWLIYPFAYSIYTLVHGVVSNWYPYPFIDPNKVGWNGVAVNSILVLLAFLIVSLVFIAAKRRSGNDTTFPESHL